jgi:hypothetical protein
MYIHSTRQGERLYIVCPEKPARTRIAVMADAQPDALLRIVAMVCALNLPTVHCVQRRIGRSMISVIIVLEACTEHAADLLCRRLSQLSCVLASQWIRAPL